MQSALPEPSATLLGYVNDRDVAALGTRLLPHARAFAADPSLSPEHAPAPRSPVYLLHGTDDSVIPAIESERLARWLEPHTRVRLLLTPLISHAEVDRKAEAADVWRLVRFWAAPLDT